MSGIASDNSIESTVDAKAFSENTFNTGFLNTGDIAPSFSGKGAANAIGMLAIARHPEKLAELREANAEGIAHAYQMYREVMPWLNEQQAFLFAMGTPAMPDQAINLFDILEKSAKLLEEKNVEPREPSEAKAAKMLDGAKNSEEWARDKWAKLIAGELETPGEYSKQAMAALDTMSAEDADAFDRFCSLCVLYNGTVDEGFSNSAPYVTKDQEGSSFGRNTLGFEEVMQLEALGLVSMEKLTTIHGEAAPSLFVHDGMYSIEGWKGSVSFGEIAFTKAGRELSHLSACGWNPSLVEIVGDDLENKGLALIPLDAPAES